MNIIFFDPAVVRNQLLPFTFTRPISDIRIGILRIIEKWEHCLPNAQFSNICVKELSTLYPAYFEEDNLYLASNCCPDPKIVNLLQNLPHESALWSGIHLLAIRTQAKLTVNEMEVAARRANAINTEHVPFLIEKKWDIFLRNRVALIKDFQLLTENRKSMPVGDPHTIVYGKENLFIEEGATITCATINAQTGPVYIGKKATVQEGALIRGALSLGEGSTLNMGAKMRGDTCIGPYCKVGGEVSNMVMFGFSNKAHDGFIGNAVIGEWCNLGADTNCSNLKNNYGNVRVWDYHTGTYEDSERQFCGLMMGDHAKAGINTMFNTGTVVGVAANVFGGGFPPKHIPSFSWGGAKELEIADLDKMMEVAKAVYARRGKEFTDAQRQLLKAVFEETKQDRNALKS